MATISKISVDGVSYDITDSTARKNANSALTTANNTSTAVSDLETKVANLKTGGKLDSVDTNSIVFIDGNGKYVQLEVDSTDNTKIKLSNYEYTKASINNNITVDGPNGAKTGNQYFSVDTLIKNTLTSDGSISYVGWVSYDLGGTITVNYSDEKPSLSITSQASSDLHINELGSISLGDGTQSGNSYIYPITGNIVAYNGYVTTINVGAVTTTKANPTTNTKEKSNTASTKFGGNQTSEVVYFYDTQDTVSLGNSGGFIVSAGLIGGLTTTSQSSIKSIKSVTKPTSEAYLYIAIKGDNTSSLSADKFVLSSDEGTVDSALLGGGVILQGTQKTYTNNTIYTIYRSLYKYSSKVYFKLL